MEELNLPQRPNTSKSDDSIKGSDGIGTKYLSQDEIKLLDTVAQFLPPQMRSFQMQDMVRNITNNNNN